MRMLVAREILKLAKAVLRTEMTFKRSPKVEDSKMNMVHHEVSRFVDTVRKNESLETFVNRADDEEAMTLEVGTSDHEEVDAIVREILALAKKVSGKYGIKMKKD